MSNRPPTGEKPSVFVGNEAAKESCRLAEAWLRLWDAQCEMRLSTLPDGRVVEDARFQGTPEQEAAFKKKTHTAMAVCLGQMLKERWASDPHPWNYINRIECETPERTAAVRRLYRSAYDATQNELGGLIPEMTPREAWHDLKDAWEVAEAVLASEPDEVIATATTRPASQQTIDQNSTTNPGVRRADLKVPSVEELRELFQAFIGLNIHNSHNVNWVWAKEEEVLTSFCRLADAIRPIRSKLDSIGGWPPVVGHAIPSLVQIFDAITESWGWGDVAAPEPDRAAYLGERKAWFEENVARPRYEAALSWQARDGVHCPGNISQIATEGWEIGGYAPTLPPDGVETAYKVADEKWVKTPRFGKCYPEIAELELSNLTAPIRQIESVLKTLPPQPAPPVSIAAPLPTSPEVAPLGTRQPKSKPTPNYTRGRLDEQAAIEITKNPSLTFNQLAAMLGCNASTLRDRQKSPLLAKARARVKAEKLAYRKGDTWSDRLSDDE